MNTPVIISQSSVSRKIPVPCDRFKNAYSNQVESISYTLPALAGGAIMDIDHAGAHTAALIIVLGRAIFGPLYYSGVPYGRLVGFGMGTVRSIYLYIILFKSL